MSYQNPREIVKTSPVASGETRTFASNLTAERLASLQIASVWEIGSRTIRRIWEAHPDPREFLARGRTGWETFGLTQVQCNALATAIAHGARALAERLAREGIRFVLPGDAEYPPHLGRTADPPGALFLRGAELKDEVRVAVVGTRKMSDYGKRATELIAGELGRNKITVVSGLALGVDGGHEACLDAGGRAIAVLPSGVDDASIAPEPTSGSRRVSWNRAGRWSPNKRPERPAPLPVPPPTASSPDSRMPRPSSRPIMIRAHSSRPGSRSKKDGRCSPCRDRSFPPRHGERMP